VADDAARDGRFSRRRLLMSAGGAAGAIALGGGGFALGREHTEENGSASSIVPFHGDHQAGIATPAQDRLVFGSFDLTVGSAAELRELLRTWTAAAVKMTTGEPVGPVATQPEAPPIDTGEALGLAAAKLTVTFGLGPGVFDDRFGLARSRPRALQPLGPLPGDYLEPARSGGDICVQACADDPQVAFHAVRNLGRIARGAAELRWLQLGFGRTSSTTSDQVTPRNLQGFKDGTNNLKADDADALARYVWVGSDEPQQWFRGGTYLVARRIRMLIEAWDRTSLGEQEQTIGRFKTTGAPLTGGSEHTTVDLTAQNPDGLPVIAANAHIRLAGHAANDGERILRRGYSYTDGIDPVTGQLDAGLFFVAFQRDPHAQFAAIQRRLGSDDALNEYVRHTSSAVFAIPPGVSRGGYVGEQLFA
jgi:deferrochelatase/peroxidase EfeB